VRLRLRKRARKTSDRRSAPGGRSDAELSRLAAELAGFAADAGEDAAFVSACAGRLRRFHDDGMARIRSRFRREPGRGQQAARWVAALTDDVVRACHRAACARHGLADRPDAFAVAAIGGYGRAEMAPFSDVDLLFLTPSRPEDGVRQAIEAILYILWDMRLKVGSAVRDVETCLQLGRADMTVRTTLLETRRVCGDDALVRELESRARERLFRKDARGFVEGKLAERDARHEAAGGSRYLLSPNIKDGKGGLRDLQTLLWLARCLHGPLSFAGFVRAGLFQPDEAEALAEAEKNLWTWRFHLHFAAGRAEERLLFEHQERIAQELGFEGGAGLRPVERFMREYYRTAKAVGDLTRIICAALEAREEKNPPLRGRLGMWFGGAAHREVDGFVNRKGRLAFPGERQLARDPASMLRIFHVSHTRQMDTHPSADRLIARNVFRIDRRLREDPEANRLFLEIVSSKRNPGRTLRRMSETGVLGRFIPEFGQVIGLMQFDLHHHYTVDEHTLKTVEMLGAIEQGALKQAHPLATSLLGAVEQRRALYVALFFHDIGKGRGGEHSEIGADIAARLCPRLGMEEAETETAVWLVRHHLLLNSTAQRRDLTDPATVRTVAEIVQERERLALLLVLTVCDMTCVSPQYWNEWKAQLLRDLHHATVSELTSGQSAPDSAARAARARQRLRPKLAEFPEDWQERFFAAFGSAFWIGLDADSILDLARLAREQETGGGCVRVSADIQRRAVKVCIHTRDRPILLAGVAAEIAAAGGTVSEVRSYVSKQGMAALVFWYQRADDRGGKLGAAACRRIEAALARVIATGKVSPPRRRPPVIAEGLRAPTRVRIDNEASELHTLIEVATADRPGLLAALATAMHAAKVKVASAVVTTYGARAVDSFYVKNAFGLKIASPPLLADLERRLRAAADMRPDEAA